MSVVTVWVPSTGMSPSEIEEAVTPLATSSANSEDLVDSGGSEGSVEQRSQEPRMRLPTAPPRA